MNYHDGCTPLMELDTAYKQGLFTFDRVRTRLKGRIACHRESVGAICAVVSLCTGDHLEIGSLFGGTAIAALLMKRAGKVVCIDPLDGYYGHAKDPTTGMTPSIQILKENLVTFGMEDRAVIVPELSHPWPLAADAQFDTALIDGDHSFEGAAMDWENCRKHVQRYVIFDNVDKKHPGVVQVFRQACADPEWRPVLLFDIVGVVERCA